MGRPMAHQKSVDLNKNWRYLILDGYIDEPASLGVPPYISPQIRSLAGGLISGGAKEDEIGYITVDQWRELRGNGKGLNILKKIETSIIVSGCVVPGKYLRGNPISKREIKEASQELKGSWTILGDPSSDPVEGVDVVKSDLGVLGESVSSSGTLSERDRSIEEWNTHLLEGAFMIWMHPDHPSPLIAEIETSRGCPRYISGGCSFCIEPKKGAVQFREPKDIIREVRALSDHGLENIRIGGQSDLLTYLSPEVGSCDVPVPDPSVIEEMMSGAYNELHSGKGVTRASHHHRRVGIDTGIVHTDNANPAVAYKHPEETKEALIAILDNTTPGTVLALGLESSDPEVQEKNNLNSGPEEVMTAIRIMNEVGSRVGINGMPHLLPGINFLGGLPGQKPESFEHDLDVLRMIIKENLLLRRINIRGALYPGKDGRLTTPFLIGKMRKAFASFKGTVRSEIDPLMLQRLIGKGTILKGVLTEARSGHVTFGRQIGSYPIMIGIEHDITMNSFVDVAITEHSSRSVTGISTPFSINTASFKDLQALPGVGKKRAASIFNDMPIGIEKAREYLRDNEWVLEHIDFST